CHVIFLFLFTLPLPPSSTPFPYTTLFRSQEDYQAASDDFRERAFEACRYKRGPLMPSFRLGRRGVGRGQRTPSILGLSSSRSLRSEEHTSELQSRRDIVCRLLLEKKK